jgi:hypothetical protein
MSELIRLTPATGAELHYSAVCDICGITRDFGIDKEKAEHRIRLHNRFDHSDETKEA